MDDKQREELKQKLTQLVQKNHGGQSPEVEVLEAGAMDRDSVGKLLASFPVVMVQFVCDIYNQSRELCKPDDTVLTDLALQMQGHRLTCYGASMDIVRLTIASDLLSLLVHAECEKQIRKLSPESFGQNGDQMAIEAMFLAYLEVAGDILKSRHLTLDQVFKVKNSMETFRDNEENKKG